MMGERAGHPCPWVTFRPPSATVRQSALHLLADQRHPLAVVAFLHDPDPRIRRQAAVALRRTSSPFHPGEAARQIENHP